MLKMLKSKSIQVLGIATIYICVSACAVKHPPPAAEIQKDAMTGIAVPSSWQAPGANGEVVQDNWLASFGDPQLDALVKEAVANNLDLRVGATRVEQAAAYIGIAKAALRPAVNVLGRGSAKGGSDLGSGLSGAILSASWELDLWGRLRYARNAAQENYLSVQADYEFARQSIWRHDRTQLVYSNRNFVGAAVGRGNGARLRSIRSSCEDTPGCRCW